MTCCSVALIAGKFTIESRIGGGGMGSVYRARQAGLDKIVAVKVLHRELLAEPTFASRFKREATSTSRIDHPSSIRVIDFGEEPDGLLYIAMEYLEGRTLFSRCCADEAPLAPARVVDLSRQILAALAAAHDLGIVHRDLKPENVLVIPGKDDDGGASEHVKVCDFGIAKLHDEQRRRREAHGRGVDRRHPRVPLAGASARRRARRAQRPLLDGGHPLRDADRAAPLPRGHAASSIVLKHLDAPPPRSLVDHADGRREARGGVPEGALEGSGGSLRLGSRDARVSVDRHPRGGGPPRDVAQLEPPRDDRDAPPGVLDGRCRSRPMSRRGVGDGLEARGRVFSEMSEPPVVRRSRDGWS